MANNETGLARDVANLAKIIELVTQCGSTYNPANNLLTLTALTQLKSQVDVDFANLQNARNTNIISTNQRDEAFATFYKTLSQINDAIKTFNISKETLKDIKAALKKMQKTSTRLTKADAGKTTEPNPENPNPEQTEEEVRKYTSSHRGYDNLVANFDSLIIMLQSVAAYTPNETNIQIATLQSLSATLKTCAQNIANSTTSLLLAMSQRNVSFYAPATGLIDTVKKIKAYIRQVYGPKSKQYLYIASLQFTKPPSSKKKKKKTDPAQ